MEPFKKSDEVWINPWYKTSANPVIRTECRHCCKTIYESAREHPASKEDDTINVQGQDMWYFVKETVCRNLRFSNECYFLCCKCLNAKYSKRSDVEQ
jgi:hypothetical protein